MLNKNQKRDLLNKAYELYQLYYENPKQDLKQYKMAIGIIQSIRNCFNPNSKEYKALNSIATRLAEMEIHILSGENPKYAFDRILYW